MKKISSKLINFSLFCVPLVVFSTYFLLLVVFANNENFCSLNDGPVGINNGNYIGSETDIRCVQERLNELGFPDSEGDFLEVDGDMGPKTLHAIKLFQAAIDPQGDGKSTKKDGRVDINGLTHKWLNAKNSPKWKELDLNSRYYDVKLMNDGGIQEERFGTSWVIWLIRSATQSTDHKEMINGISAKNGIGSSQWHNTHQAGMDIDINIDQSKISGGNNLEIKEKQKIIDSMKAFYQYTTDHSESATVVPTISRILVGYEDVVTTFNKETETSIAQYTPNSHHNHFHIDLQPPLRIEGSTPNTLNNDKRIILSLLSRILAFK